MRLYLYTTMAEIRLSEKKWAEAELLLQQGMALAERLNSDERRAGCRASARYHLRLAEMLAGQGKQSDAQAHLQRGKQIAQAGNFGRL